MHRQAVFANGYTLNTRLYGRLDKSHPRPGLVLLPGWHPGTSAWTTSDVYAWLLARRFGFICLTVALRGMGSPGAIASLTRADFLDDATVAYDFLAGLEGIDATRLTVVGESFGSYLACLLSSRRPVRSLALRVPTDFPDDGFTDMPHVGFVGDLSLAWKHAEHGPSDSRALAAIHAFRGRILIVASERDRVVPFQTTSNCLRSAPASERLEFRTMRGAGHALVNPRRIFEFYKTLAGWIERESATL